MDSFRVSRGGGRRETGSQVFERGARLGGLNQQLRQGQFLHGSRTPAATTLWEPDTSASIDDNRASNCSAPRYVTPPAGCRADTKQRDDQASTARVQCSHHIQSVGAHHEDLATRLRLVVKQRGLVLEPRCPRTRPSQGRDLSGGSVTVVEQAAEALTTANPTGTPTKRSAVDGRSSVPVATHMGRAPRRERGATRGLVSVRLNIRTL
jgi:hypothetical protein